MNKEKLVRDKIPQIIEQSGKKCEIKILSEQEFKTALWEKLQEEVEEAIATQTTNELMEELADIYEVIDNILTTYNLDQQIIFQLQQEKRKNKGGFQKKIKVSKIES